MMVLVVVAMVGEGVDGGGGGGGVGGGCTNSSTMLLSNGTARLIFK